MCRIASCYCILQTTCILYKDKQSQIKHLNLVFRKNKQAVFTGKKAKRKLLTSQYKIRSSKTDSPQSWDGVRPIQMQWHARRYRNSSCTGLQVYKLKGKGSSSTGLINPTALAIADCFLLFFPIRDHLTLYFTFQPFLNKLFVKVHVLYNFVRMCNSQ